MAGSAAGSTRAPGWAGRPRCPGRRPWPRPRRRRRGSSYLVSGGSGVACAKPALTSSSPTRKRVPSRSTQTWRRSRAESSASDTSRSRMTVWPLTSWALAWVASGAMNWTGVSSLTASGASIPSSARTAGPRPRRPRSCPRRRPARRSPRWSGRSARSSARGSAWDRVLGTGAAAGATAGPAAKVATAVCTPPRSAAYAPPRSPIASTAASAERQRAADRPAGRAPAEDGEPPETGCVAAPSRRLARATRTGPARRRRRGAGGRRAPAVASTGRLARRQRRHPRDRGRDRHRRDGRRGAPGLRRGDGGRGAGRGPRRASPSNRGRRAGRRARRARRSRARSVRHHRNRATLRVPQSGQNSWSIGSSPSTGHTRASSRLCLAGRVGQCGGV